jgi:hypothetical protein
VLEVDSRLEVHLLELPELREAVARWLAERRPEQHAENSSLFREVGTQEEAC